MAAAKCEIIVKVINKSVVSVFQSIIVRWEAPASRSHGGPLTGYKVRYRAGAAPGGGPGGARRKADSLTTPANARRAELRDLDTATTYQVHNPHSLHLHTPILLCTFHAYRPE